VSSGQVLRLKRALYGLKQAPLEWYRTLMKYLIDELGFTSCMYDPCILWRMDDDGIVLMGVYVDDVLIAASKVSKVDGLIMKMNARFKLRDLGYPKSFLGITVKYNKGKDSRSITLLQRGHVEALCAKYGIGDEDISTVPMMYNTRLGADEEGEPCGQPYRELVGSLLYLSVWTRPDIAYTVSQLCRHLDKPKQCHWEAAITLLKYLNHTKSYGLVYECSKNVKCNACDVLMYSDADWARDVVTSKSQSGYCIFVNDMLVAWHSSLQSVVAQSSGESEYVALTTAAKEGMYFYNLLSELKMNIQVPMVIRGDNEASLKMVVNKALSAKVRHIRIRQHYIKQLYDEGLITLRWISTEDMLADIMTKPLTPAILTRMRGSLLRQVNNKELRR
jgi:hypothetical protein